MSGSATGDTIGQPPRVLTGDEWEAQQYAPHRLGQDPKKPMGPGRVLTGDEWEKASASSSIKNLTFPTVPKFAADATQRLNPNAGQADQPLFEKMGEGVRNVSNVMDVVGQSLPLGGATLSLPAILGRQVVAPAIEHPIVTAAMMNPVGAVAGGLMAAHTVAKYGWQIAHESQMTPEEKAQALKDPNRVSGEAAAVQAVMLGLGGLAGVKALGSIGDVSAGVTEAGAAGLKGLSPTDASLSDYIRADKHYFESAKGAEVLGTTAAAHGLPATASPYLPDSPLAVSWQQGHSTATQVNAPAAPPETAPPVTPEPTPSGSVAGEPMKAGPGLTPIEGTGALRTRGLAASTERDAVAAEIADHFKDLPQYRTMDSVAQSDLATEFVTKDPARAERVAFGEEPAPEGLHSSSVYIALKHKAFAEGDAVMVDRLIDNPIISEATAHGQWIKMLDDHDPTIADPVRIAQHINATREAFAKNPEKAIANDVRTATNTIADVNAIDMPMLIKFINALRC